MQNCGSLPERYPKTKANRAIPRERAVVQLLCETDVESVCTVAQARKD